MLAVRGIYENGKIKLLEPIPFKKKARVIITIIEDIFDQEDSTPLDLFDDLVGVISVRSDGSMKHDEYIYSRENL
jgi:predicted DNA-binding antitoxin AbrB/MazE fold protein